MLVAAKYQIAYKNVLYTAGQEFEIEDKDLFSYVNDVTIPRKLEDADVPKVEKWNKTMSKNSIKKELKKEKNKMVKSYNSSTK
jgi:hypothetical protein